MGRPSNCEALYNGESVIHDRVIQKHLASYDANFTHYATAPNRRTHILIFNAVSCSQ